MFLFPYRLGLFFSLLLLACGFSNALFAQAGPVTLPVQEAREQNLQLTTGQLNLPPLAAGAFTVVVIPDTQYYTGKNCKLTPESTAEINNPHLQMQIEWILKHQESEKIEFVTHVGDIVEKDRSEEWSVAKSLLDGLRDQVRFSLTVGNHDMSSKGDASLFQKTFPASSFEKYDWYGGCYQHARQDQHVSANNVNSYQLFEAGNIPFLHLSLECNAPDDVLAWAEEILNQHKKRLTIITTHMDLGIITKPETHEEHITGDKGRMQWHKIHKKRGNTAQQMWNKLYRHHSQIKLILSGDQSRVTAFRTTDKTESGTTIHALLSDYMSQPVLRLLRFHPSKNKLEVITFDVAHDVIVDKTLYVADPSQHNFELTMPMQSFVQSQ